ncbi:MAG: poly(R)-hydroxyalkanoic acid synthase subunit PhaE [Myxococcota bacterium]
MTVNGDDTDGRTAPWLGPLATLLGTGERSAGTAPGETPWDTLRGWELFKESYDAWERAASPFFESMLRSASLLEPGGSLLGAIAQWRAQQQRMAAAWWSLFGLPTRNDQQRTLHALHELQSRLIDLEEKLHDLEARRNAWEEAE